MYVYEYIGASVLSYRSLIVASVCHRSSGCPVIQSKRQRLQHSDTRRFEGEESLHCASNSSLHVLPHYFVLFCSALISFDDCPRMMLQMRLTALRPRNRMSLCSALLYSVLHNSTKQYLSSSFHPHLFYSEHSTILVFHILI